MINGMVVLTVYLGLLGVDASFLQAKRIAWRPKPEIVMLIPCESSTIGYGGAASFSIPGTGSVQISVEAFSLNLDVPTRIQEMRGSKRRAAERSWVKSKKKVFEAESKIYSRTGLTRLVRTFGLQGWSNMGAMPRTKSMRSPSLGEIKIEAVRLNNKSQVHNKSKSIYVFAFRREEDNYRIMIEVDSRKHLSGKEMVTWLLDEAELRFVSSANMRSTPKAFFQGKRSFNWKSEEKDGAFLRLKDALPGAEFSKDDFPFIEERQHYWVFGQNQDSLGDDLLQTIDGDFEAIASVFERGEGLFDSEVLSKSSKPLAVLFHSKKDYQKAFESQQKAQNPLSAELASVGLWGTFMEQQERSTSPIHRAAHMFYLSYIGSSNSAWYDEGLANFLEAQFNAEKRLELFSWLGREVEDCNFPFGLIEQLPGTDASSMTREKEHLSTLIFFFLAHSKKSTRLKLYSSQWVDEFSSDDPEEGFYEFIKIGRERIIETNFDFEYALKKAGWSSPEKFCSDLREWGLRHGLLAEIVQK